MGQSRLQRLLEMGRKLLTAHRGRKPKFEYNLKRLPGYGRARSLAMRRFLAPISGTMGLFLGPGGRQKLQKTLFQGSKPIRDLMKTIGYNPYSSAYKRVFKSLGPGMPRDVKRRMAQKIITGGFESPYGKTTPLAAGYGTGQRAKMFQRAMDVVPGLREDVSEGNLNMARNRFSQYLQAARAHPSGTIRGLAKDLPLQYMPSSMPETLLAKAKIDRARSGYA